MTLQTAVHKYMKFMEIINSSSPHTLTAYVNDLGQAFGSCKNDKVAIGREDALLSVARKAQLKWAKLSLASRNRKTATLKSFFGYLYQEKILGRDLSLLLLAPKVGRRLPDFISVDEVMAVIASFDSTPSSQLGKTLFLLLYGSGLRISEACGLRWKDVNPEKRSLRILGKGQRVRLVIMPPAIASRLNHLQSTSNKEEYVWGERPLPTRKAYQIIHDQGVKAGLLKPLHPHALRHSFATHLLASGANLRTLQELLGHESLQATEKYTHLGIDQLARTLQRHHPLSKTKT